MDRVSGGDVAWRERRGEQPQSGSGAENAKSKGRIYETFPIRNFDHWIIERELKLANRNVKTESWNPETGN